MIAIHFNFATGHSTSSFPSLSFLKLPLSFLILPYPTLSFLILSYPFLSFLIFAYPFLSFLILSYPFISFLILSYPSFSRGATRAKVVTLMSPSVYFSVAFSPEIFPYVLSSPGLPIRKQGLVIPSLKSSNRVQEILKY